MRLFTVAIAAVAAGLSGLLAGAPAPRAAQSDLDALMQKVLARRDENWKKLQQYILEENEKIDIRGPAGVPLWGEQRDYAWFIRDGFFIRSPLKVNGVTINEAERKKAEDDYYKRAQNRERQRARGATPGRGEPAAAANDAPTDVEGFIKQTRQPEFMDSAYFLRFKFEQGKYAFVGRESFDGMDVLKIEYYPARLFSHDQDVAARAQRQGRMTRDQQADSVYEQMLNKVALVTIWVEPKTNQIVKYTFDNVNFDFLPAAWLVRVKDLKASMTMNQPFKDQKDLWLPRDVDFYFRGILAVGTIDGRYHIDYRNYQEATTASRIKIKDPGR